MGSARINAKEREKTERQVRRAKKTKRIKERRTKPPTTTRTIDVLIGDEEQNGKQKKETGSGTPGQLNWTIQSPPTTCRGHTVRLFF